MYIVFATCATGTLSMESRTEAAQCNDRLKAHFAMADLIEKIGRFFAEQEAQVQETLSHLAHASARASPPLSKPPPPIHGIPTHSSAEFGRRSHTTNSALNYSRNKSHAQRRLSATASTTTTRSQRLHDGGVQAPDTANRQGKIHEVPIMRLFAPLPLNKQALREEGVWSHNSSTGLISSEPRSSPASVNSNKGSSAKDEDLVSQTSTEASERLRKPRPPRQKHHKRTCKKKRSLSDQEKDQPDPKTVAKATAERVTAALMLAQERAKRIQQEKLQLERKQELERQEAAFRLQEQLARIEAIRAKSFRQSTKSLLNCEASSNAESVWTADTNDMMESHQPPGQFMARLEAQLKEKMSLEMYVKRSCIEKHKQRERVRRKLDKALQYIAAQSPKIARLAAMKASLELELAAVLDDTAQTRQQWRELEIASEKARCKRQREAEKALQVRLREEEWRNMMEDEKSRSQVAAEARMKAGKRVEAHSAKLRRAMRTYLYEPRHSVESSSAMSSSKSNNNNSSNSDDGNDTISSEDVPNNWALSNTIDLLPPELADFEEDGLSNNVEQQPPSSTGPSFTWQVQSFSDRAKFTEILLGMVSDDDDE